MKNVFLRIVFLTIVLSVLTLFTMFLPYSFASTGRACTLLNSDVGGLLVTWNSTMSKAKTLYDSLGYTTNCLTDPSPLTIVSNAASCKIQIYACHGNQQYIQFPSGGLCTYSSNFTDNEGREYYTIDSIDWSNTKLAILNACNSAGDGESNSNAIAPKIVSKGAQMSIGWYTEINPFVSPYWIENFNLEIEAGYNPLVAVNRANAEYLYVGDTIKNTLVSYRSLSTLSLDEKELESCTLENNILPDNIIGDVTESEVENYLETINPSFNTEDYEKNISDGLYAYNIETDEIQHICSYIDYTLKIGDYTTNSGYTVVLSDDGIVQQVVDNTIVVPYEVVRNNNEREYEISDELKVSYINRAKNNIENPDDIIEEEISFYYDLEENTKDAIVTLKVKDDLLDYKIYSYSYEL